MPITKSRCCSPAQNPSCASFCTSGVFGSLCTEKL